MPIDDTRALLDELHAEATAAAAAVDDDDMQTWLRHARRGAEIHEELAKRYGWREDRVGLVHGE